MDTHSHKAKRPSAKNPKLKLAATIKKKISLRKVSLATLKGLTMAIEPDTMAVIKLAAPMSSPTARLPLCVLIAANVEKTSGLPLPKARKVTPAKVSLRPSRVEMVLRLIL